MSQTSQPEMFPEFGEAVPPIALRYWRAVARYFETGAVDPPTRKQVVDQMILNDADKPASESTIDRACKDYPQYCPKPRTITRYTRPPWEAREEIPLKQLDQLAQLADVVHVTLEATDSHGMPCIVEAVSDEHGVLRLMTRISTLMAVGMGSFAVLDSLDGKMDGVIHWCELLGRLGHLNL